MTHACNNPDHDIWVHMYVDDDLVAVNEKVHFEWFVAELSKHFQVGSATTAEHYLGICITQQGGVIKLDQQASVEDLLRAHGMENANPKATPCDAKCRLPKLKDDEARTKEPYRSLVGALLYLSMHTRPDIGYAVHELARHCSAPGERH